MPEILPGQLLRLFLNYYEYEMLIERDVCLYFTAFLQRATDVVVVKLFTKFTLQENRMTAKLSIGWIQSNSKLVSAKHWTYQTLNEYINAFVMILSIDKYKLLN